MYINAKSTLATLTWTLVSGIGLAAAEPLTTIQGDVNGQKFLITAPASLADSVAMLKSPTATAPTEFGGAAIGQRLGFRQLVVRPDQSAMILTLALPPDMINALKPGTYTLGNTPVDHDGQGWDGTCPDLEEDKPLFSVTYYGVPTNPNAPHVMGIPAGEFERYLQTHHTRIRHDNAELVIKTIDKARRTVSGEIHGEISYVAAKDSEEANDKKTYKWRCRPSEFITKVETVKVLFQINLTRNFGK